MSSMDHLMTSTGPVPPPTKTTTTISTAEAKNRDGSSTTNTSANNSKNSGSKKVSMAPSLKSSPTYTSSSSLKAYSLSKAGDSTSKVAMSESVSTSSSSTTAAARRKAEARKTMVVNGGNVDEVAKKIGFIVEEFKCTHNNFSGMLYAGPLGLVFLGRFLLFQWTVSVKWDDVVRVVQKQDRKGQQVDILIETSGNSPSNSGYTNGSGDTVNQPQTYLFERFFDPSKALNTLASLHNDSMLDVKTTPTPRILSRGLRRMNSDPLRISNMFNFDDMPSLHIGDDIDDMEDFRKDLAGVNNTFSSSKVGATANDPPLMQRFATYTFTSDVGVGRTPRVQTQSPPPLGRTPSGTAVGSTSTSNKNSSGPTDDRADWDHVLVDLGGMKEILVKDYLLAGCNLDDFVADFVDDDAVNSLARYMEETGEEDVTVTPWKEGDTGDTNDKPKDPLIAKSVLENDDGPKKTRKLAYVHPVNAPMAPPKAGARKEQTFRRYGEHGLIIETKTFVSDVPMTDCFYVCDVMRVEPGEAVKDDDNGASPGVVVNIHCDIRFVKSTMFQSLITKTTKGELKHFMETLIDFMNASMRKVKDAGEGQNTDSEKVVPRLSKQATKASPPASNMALSSVAAGLLLLIVLLQIWILWDMRSMKFEVRNMIAEMTSVQNQQQQVCTGVAGGRPSILLDKGN